METTLKDQFITLWDTYFPQAGLPITFEYSADTQNLPVVEAPKGHRCIIAQLTQVQRGKTLCIQEKENDTNKRRNWLRRLWHSYPYFLSRGKT